MPSGFKSLPEVRPQFLNRDFQDSGITRIGQVSCSSFHPENPGSDCPALSAWLRCMISPILDKKFPNRVKKVHAFRSPLLLNLTCMQAVAFFLHMLQKKNSAFRASGKPCFLPGDRIG
jgi:hypothetical protein